MALRIRRLKNNIVSANRHDIKTSMIEKTVDDQFIFHHDDNSTSIGPSRENIVFDNGYRLYSQYFKESGAAKIFSSLTNKCVAIVSTNTPQYVVGTRTVAWLTGNGIKACQLSAPDHIFWVAKFDTPVRVAFLPCTDTLVVVTCGNKAPTFVYYDLRKDVSEKKQTTSFFKTKANAPEFVGPLLCTDGGTFCIMVIDNKCAICQKTSDILEPPKYFSFALSDICDFNHRVNISKSYGYINDYGAWGVVNLFDQNYNEKSFLCFAAGKKRSVVNVPGNSVLLVGPKKTVFVWHSNSIFELTSTLSKIDYANTIRLCNFHNNTLKALCRKCRQPRTTSSYNDVCSFCSTPETLSCAYGKAISYFQNKYKHRFGKEEAKHLNKNFKTYPTCAWSGKSHDLTKLVFVPMEPWNRKKSIFNLILIEWRLRNKTLPLIVKNLGTHRWTEMKLCV